MPGDTLIVTSSGDTVLMQDSSFRELQAYMKRIREEREYKLRHQDDGQYIFFGFILAMTLMAALMTRRFFGIRLFKRRQYRKIQEDAAAELQSHHDRYDTVLSVYNSYYRSLSPILRNRFLQRVTEFMEIKKFEYIDITPDDKMPLLISAAAIQLTLGLDKYLMEYFDKIYVLKNNYRYGFYNVPFMGHVSSNGIYLSWDNFLRGYENENDADNVGVHEMAHALAYVNFMADSGDDEDDEFKKRFRDFSVIARPVFNDMQNGTVNLLGSYAATNYNEFWAVAVENFFERPQQLKDEMTELYTAMSVLLNQDPLLNDKGIYPG